MVFDEKRRVGYAVSALSGPAREWWSAIDKERPFQSFEFALLLRSAFQPANYQHVLRDRL